MFLDEALIKADAHFTGRAIGAWRGLGFQLVIGAPNDCGVGDQVEFSERLPTGVEVVRWTLAIRGVVDDFPVRLNADLDGAAMLIADTPTGTEPPAVDVGRARSIASELRLAGAILTPTTLRAAYRLPDTDVEVLVSAVMVGGASRSAVLPP